MGKCTRTQSAGLEEFLLTALIQNPKEGCEEHIERSETTRSGEEDLPGSRYPQVSLSQGSVEQAFLNFLERDDNSSRVERNLSPAKLHVDEASVEDNDAYPVEVHLRELGKDETAGSLEYTGQYLGKVYDHLLTMH